MKIASRVPPLGPAAIPAYLLYKLWLRRFRQIRAATALLGWGGAPLKHLAAQLLPIMPHEPAGSFPEIKATSFFGNGPERASGVHRRRSRGGSVSGHGRSGARTSSVARRLGRRHSGQEQHAGWTTERQYSAAWGGHGGGGGYDEEPGAHQHHHRVSAVASQQLRLQYQTTRQRSQNLLSQEEDPQGKAPAPLEPTAMAEADADAEAGDYIEAIHAAVVDEHAAEMRRFAVCLLEAALGCRVDVDDSTLAIDLPEEVQRFSPGSPLRSTSCAKRTAAPPVEVVVVGPGDPGLDSPLVPSRESEARRRRMSSAHEGQAAAAAGLPCGEGMDTPPTADVAASAAVRPAASGGGERTPSAAGPEPGSGDGAQPNGLLRRLSAGFKVDPGLLPLKPSLSDRRLEAAMLARSSGHVWGPDESQDEDAVWQSAVSTYAVSTMVIVFFSW